MKDITPVFGIDEANTDGMRDDVVLVGEHQLLECLACHDLELCICAFKVFECLRDAQRQSHSVKVADEAVSNLFDHFGVGFHACGWTAAPDHQDILGLHVLDPGVSSVELRFLSSVFVLLLEIV